MLETTSSVRIVLTTASNHEEAVGLARALVEERLAACASLMPGAESVYRWKGAIETAAEVMILLKTTEEKLAALENRLHALHSYETPEFLVLPATAVSSKYGAWLIGCLSEGEAGSS